MRRNREVLLAAAALCAGALCAGATAAFAVDLGDGLVHLRAETYAVRTGPASVARESAVAPDETESWIVAVSGPAGPALRRRIAALGARIVGYVPSNAYIVRADPRAVARLRKEPAVARVDLFRDAWKISPDISRRSFRDPARVAMGRELLLFLHVFEGEDVDRVARRAAAAGAGTVTVQRPAGRVVVSAPPEALPRLAALSAVEWVDEVEEIDFRNDNVRWVIQSNLTDVTPLYDHGLLGEGEIIGHLDGEILRTSCFFEDTTDNTPGKNHRKLVAYVSSGATGGRDHGTHTAGTAAGDREPTTGSLVQRGMAPKARLWYGNVNDVTGIGNFFSNLPQYLQSAYEGGARVFTNSWGEPSVGMNTYTTLCVSIDAFARANEDALVLFAIANSSHTGKVLAPENSKNCLAVAGSAKAPGQDNPGSGVPGPTFDGRRKPEVTAPSISTVSADLAGCATRQSSGTSMACPAVAGGAALVRQYLRNGFYPTGQAWPQHAVTPTGALLKAIVVNSAVDMTGIAGYPTDREGWGRILLDDALYFQGDTRRLLFRDVRNAQGLAVGESEQVTFRVVDSFEPLKITMAFTDQPAALLAALTPVNDLDLEVVAPGGATYLGNVFDTAVGVSIPGGAADALNNVERVVIDSPAVGLWTVRVRGAAIPMGPQGYAVAVNGGLFQSAPQTGGEPADGPSRGSSVRAAPDGYRLGPLQPSPFRTSTTVRFAVPERSSVRVSVYDVRGRRVRSLLDRDVAPGEYRLTWDGRDDAGRPAAAGIYFARLESAAAVRTVRTVLLR